MIYLDTSVALAHLLAEDQAPPPELWKQPLISSRLLEYEIWVRIHDRKLAKSHADAVRALLGCVALVELASPVVARAIEPFPIRLRTLDALHLATLDFLRAKGQNAALATYDERLLQAASLMGFELY